MARTATRQSRHTSWASDTVIFGVIFVIVLIATVLTDQLNGADPAPAYLTGLLGAAGAALFGAAGSDKSKREAEIAADARIARRGATETRETANRAEAKADTLRDLAKAEHPEHHEFDEPPLIDPNDGDGGP